MNFKYMKLRAGITKNKGYEERWFNMVYLTGDRHGTFDDIGDFCEEYGTTKDDVLIMLGDVGINYHGNPYDLEKKISLSQLPVTLFCIHGNHEMRPETIPTYVEDERFGGAVWTEPEFPNLLFAIDGEIYDFDGIKCIVIGGANSIDKHKRTRGIDWWEDEQPSDAIKYYVEQKLESVNWRVDTVLSHTCPYKYLDDVVELNTDFQHMIDSSTEKWLDSIEDRLDYSRWYCGHFHIDEYIGNLRFMNYEFIELE